MEFIVLIIYVLGWIVLGVSLAAAGLLLLRVLLTWVGANPFGRISYHLTRLTEPIVRPLRYQFGSGRFMRYDMLPLVMGVMFLVMGLFISSVIWQFSQILSDVSKSTLTPRFLAGSSIRLFGLFYVVAIFLRFFLPFFGVSYSSKFYRFVFKITEPLLKPLRRFFVAGMFDFSPLIAMLIVQLLTNWIASTVTG
ncbi:MAG TPA: YggT family protein [Blastocatellia bacterium]|nr:YggT family protein [Blastocatellia bacterium]